MRPVPNLTLRREDGRVVAESVIVADSTMRRLRGLLGKRDLPSGHGVLLRPAWSIHTAFMRFPIDVVFLDAGPGRRQDRPAPAAVQDGVVPRRPRGRRAPRRRVRPARASRSATESPGQRGRTPTRCYLPAGSRAGGRPSRQRSCSRAAISDTSSSCGSCSTGRGSTSSRASRLRVPPTQPAASPPTSS